MMCRGQLRYLLCQQNAWRGKNLPRGIIVTD